MLFRSLALSQVLWGLGYRWVNVTNGDNGLSGLTRPEPFGINLDGAMPYYYFALVVVMVMMFVIARFVQSPFGSGRCRVHAWAAAAVYRCVNITSS